MIRRNALFDKPAKDISALRYKTCTGASRVGKDNNRPWIVHTSAPVKPLILMVLKSNINKKYTTTAPRADIRKARRGPKPKSPVKRNVPLQYDIRFSDRFNSIHLRKSFWTLTVK